MKRKTFIPLMVLGLSLLPAVLRSQNRPASPEEAAAAREVGAQQNPFDQIQRNEDLAAKQQAEAADEYKWTNGFKDRLQALVRRAPGSPGRSMITRFSSVLQGLVIRSSELDPKEQASLEEDLAVMSHLLEKSVGSSLGLQPQGGPVLGVNLVFAPGHNPTRGLYLEGYGALFTLSVCFPLLPSPKNDEEKENPSTDSAWNEARQEVYGQQRMDGKAVYVRGEEYDERKVNRLKDAALEALKNATHIRGLKGDDWVTVCVCGGQSMILKGSDQDIRQELTDLRKQETELRTRYTDTWPTVRNIRDKIQALELALAGKQPRSTMLTIRVKKSDVDAFAKDKLNLDDFRKRAKIMPYAGGPETATAGGFVAGGGGGGFGEGRTFGGGVGF
jgi:hypothetical protein